MNPTRKQFPIGQFRFPLAGALVIVACVFAFFLTGGRMQARGGGGGNPAYCGSSTQYATMCYHAFITLYNVSPVTQSTYLVNGDATCGPCALADNAYLSNLVLGAGSLSPGFSPFTLNYTLTVPNGTDSTTVSPTAAGPIAIVTVNDVPVASGSFSNPISLNVGQNTITTVVMAQDTQTTHTYTVNVMRLAEGSQILVTNLLVNPGAETGDVSGWTVGGNSNPFADNGSFDPSILPHTGGFDFCGRTGSFGSLSQTFNLLGIAGITTDMVDTGRLQANVSFWEQGLNQDSSSDHGAISLTFLDSAANTNGPVVTQAIDSHDLTWKNYTNNFSIPPGTRQVQYTMQFIRMLGSDNDSFIDDNVLGLSTPSIPVTDPPTLVIQNNGNYSLSWPASATGYGLETTTTLSPPNWQPVTNSPVTIGPNQVLAIPVPITSFYRLHSQ